MGRLEKIVVLTVLFLVTVILGVSLNQREGSAAGPVSAAGLASDAGLARGTDPIRTAARPTGGAAPAGERARPAVPADVELARREEPLPRPLGVEPAGRREGSGMLSAVVERPGEPREAAAEEAGAPAGAGADPALARAIEGTLLVDARGLIASPSPEYFFYEWRAGDTWTALAQRLYGERRHTSLLLAANEGKSSDRLRAGERVWIPARAQEDPSQAGEVRRTAAGREYVVAGGDSLTTISEKVYGTMRRWREIYDANRDVLDDPDRLKVGTKLRIP